MNKLGRGIGGALLSLAFVFGIYAAASNTAQAQNRNDDRYYRRDRDRDDDRRDRNRDWRRRDGRHDNGRHLGWYKNGKYRNDGYRNDGYNGGYNNGRYRNGGYGNGGYGNNGYYQQDLNRGYQQGLNTGANDARRGQNYSPERSHFYRDGQYSQAFREGFVRGYDQGYRQYAGYGNGTYRNRRSNNGGLGNILGGILRPY